MSFPSRISLTITNACNLRCRMCGQWSDHGYVRGDPARIAGELALSDWIRVIDEVAAHGVKSILLRGGEPFVHPQIIELLEHIHSKGIYIAIDTNGTRLERYARDIVRIGDVHLTISVDGPEEIHDRVRGVPGTFAALRRGIGAIAAAEAAAGVAGTTATISRSLNFTISPWSVAGLGDLPDVARSLGVRTVCIVPYYYMPHRLRQEYRQQLRELGCDEYSATGFEHETSGVDPLVFEREYERFLGNLREIVNYPYMPLTVDEYRLWFTHPTAPVGLQRCLMVDRLLDIQPDGRANFCVDFPDFSPGNVREQTIEEIWNGPRADAFRSRRRQGPLGACHRCGARYMAEMKD